MAAVIQRPLRGSRISTFYPVKNLPSLASLDSAFQLQEYISLLIRLDVHDVDAIVSLPGSSSKDKDAASDKDKEEHTASAKEGDKDAEKGKNEVTVDEACWIYEQLRRLAQDLSHPLITTLQQECTRASCPEMKAGEWLYLCVAHGNDGAMEQCCAIDYILHTVDSATALLNSPRTFPSRLQIPQTSHRHFSSLARRLGRIFAHAYFHHREAFEQAEAESSLYARFLALTAKFDLVPAEFLVIPSAQFTGEDSGSGSERDHSPRGYGDSRQHYPPQLREEDHRLLPAAIAQRQLQQQQQLGIGRSRSPNPPGLTEGTGNGGIGESPTSSSRSRFGRNRTDTMVFADAEASAVADELAAKARAGELEAEDEHEGPKTARPSIETEQGGEEADMETEGETETQFEISLSPDEEIAVSFAEEASAVPTPETKAAENEVANPVSEASPALAEPAPALELEKPPAETEKPGNTGEDAPTVVPTAVEEKVDEEPTIEPTHSEETTLHEPAAEEPALAPEAEVAPPPATPESSALVADKHTDVQAEVKEATSEEKVAREAAPEPEPIVEPAVPVPTPTVENEATLKTEKEIVEIPLPSTAAPSTSDISVPVAEPAAVTLAPIAPAADPTPVDTSSPVTQEAVADVTKEEELALADSVAAVADSSAIKALDVEPTPHEDPITEDVPAVTPAHPVAAAAATADQVTPHAS
ncbi:hypothetical protein BDZ97DRAFT_1846595 [Flammula alnicola]|nr:hypothetical protein BDZ97DRAFT_1846595 [Flammula alnicola]